MEVELVRETGRPAQGHCYETGRVTCNVDYLFNPFAKAKGKVAFADLTNNVGVGGGGIKAPSELEVNEAFMFGAVVSPSAPNLSRFSEQKKPDIMKFECITKLER